jgi:catechol 2,3-dioxygenase-like lactoylglutathione lyase family enzyme
MPNELSCTHIVLYVEDVNATHHFYTERLGCSLRRFSANEKFLSIAVGNFVINFDGSCPDLIKGYQQGIAHLGFEVETRATVDYYAERLKSSKSFWDKRNALHGPYRFYVSDPDGYTIEIHTWNGVKEGSR